MNNTQTNSRYVLVVGLLLMASASFITAQVQVTGFGSGDGFSQTSSTFFVNNQTATDFNVFGFDDAQLTGALAAPVAVGTNVTSVDLTGTMFINPGGAFTIALGDASGGRIEFAGVWSSYTSGSETVTLNFAQEVGTFDGLATTFGLFQGGAGSNQLNFTLDNLTAVPEPSSALLLSVGALGLAAYRRRMNRSSSAG